MLLRCTITRVAAVQSWPAFEVAGHRDALGRLAAMSASSNTITGALPPSSRCTRFTVGAAAVATALPARVLPVIDTIAGIGCEVSARRSPGRRRSR